MSATGSQSPRSSIPRRTVLSLSAAAGIGVAAGTAGCSGGGSDGSTDKLKQKVDHPSDNLKAKGFPIVKDPVTLHFMTRRWATNAKDFNKVLSWKKYQKMTHIKIDWGLEPLKNISEKRNLALSSGDYPEAFHGCGFDGADVEKYGSQGIFIKLNRLIDKYMPNLKKLMDDIPRGQRRIDVPRRKHLFDADNMGSEVHLDAKLQPSLDSRGLAQKAGYGHPRVHRRLLCVYEGL